VAEGTLTPADDRVGVEDEVPGVVLVAPVVASPVGVLDPLVDSLGAVVVASVVAGASDVVVGTEDVLAGATGALTSLVVPAGVATVSGRT